MAAATALRDSDLVDFATGEGSSRKASVIVEAKREPVPANRRASARIADDLLPGPASTRRSVAGPAKASFAAAMADIEAALERLGLAKSARRNDLSGSFVVEVTPGQLRELSSAPSVQAIRRNRRHRRVAI